MAAAAIKIASAAPGDNAKKKKPSHSATHPEDEEKRAENDLKKIEEAMAFPTTGILKYQRHVRSGASGSRSRRAALDSPAGLPPAPRAAPDLPDPRALSSWAGSARRP